MYEIGNTVSAVTGNHPVANDTFRWIGVVTEVIRDGLAYRCKTVYSDRKIDREEKTEVTIRPEYVNRYSLQEGDKVELLNGSNAGKKGTVGTRTSQYRINVTLDDGTVVEDYAVRHTKLIAPYYCTHAALPIATRVRAKNKALLPKELPDNAEGVIIGVGIGNDDDFYAVSWNDFTNGHDCNGMLTNNSGWYCPSAAFEVLEQGPQKEIDVVMPENETSFLVGDVVRHKVSVDMRLWLGEVVAIRGRSVWVKLHGVRAVKKNAAGVLVRIEDTSMSDRYTFEAHECASADDLVLVHRDGANVVHDAYTNKDLSGATYYTTADTASYDLVLGKVFPTYLSQSSYDRHAYTCAKCGEVHLRDSDRPIEVTRENGDVAPFCRSCANIYCVRCAHCGRIMEGDTTILTEVHCGDDDDSDYTELWCDDCLDTSAGFCTEHQCYYNEYYGCPICGSNGKIHNYSYKPDPVFFKMSEEEVDNHTFYYGVEDETEGSGDNPTKFSRKLGNTVSEVYCKRDGSLNNGAEVVTHPCTIKYHIESDMWDRIASAGTEYLMKSHNTTTCGLHVHISRKPFEAAGIVDYEDRLTLAYDRFKGYWKAISRRREANCRWSGFLSDKRGEKTNTKLSDVKSKKDKFDRYQAVNLCNSNTVEIRIFRGTLKVDTIKATLWLVDAVNRFIVNGGDVENCRFTDLIDLANAPDFVKEYLVARELPVL